jgi:hypothetical protein
VHPNPIFQQAYAFTMLGCRRCHNLAQQASWILLFSNPPECGASAVDQQRAQRAIATFADAE